MNFDCSNYTIYDKIRFQFHNFKNYKELSHQMIILYSGGGSHSIEFTNKFSLKEFEQSTLYNACQLLIARGETEAANMLASGNFEFWEATNDFNDEFYVMSTVQPITMYEKWNKLLESDERKTFRQLFSSIAQAINEIGIHPIEESYLRFIVCHMQHIDVHDNWQVEIIGATGGFNNQGLFNFKDIPKLTHDGLNFRSKTEIKVYSALLKRGLLILPLPVAILGDPKVRREPDFVVIYKGRMGILEIHGDAWHPTEMAAKESERRRMFRNLGVAIYEIFDAKTCWDTPDKVVNDFLRSFDLAHNP